MVGWRYFIFDEMPIRFKELEPIKEKLYYVSDCKRMHNQGDTEAYIRSIFRLEHLAEESWNMFKDVIYQVLVEAHPDIGKKFRI